MKNKPEAIETVITAILLIATLLLLYAGCERR